LSNNSLPSVNYFILGLGVILIIGLSWAGFSTSTVDEEAKHAEHQAISEPVAPFEVKDFDLPADADLEAEVKKAVTNIELGKKNNDMNLMMNEGIKRLSAVIQRDSSNVSALYQLGMFSLESGQIEKAEKRFEKLVLLQPENQEYKETLQMIHSKLKK
jgi:tetratricopeptide (TPR) repeat protein